MRTPVERLEGEFNNPTIPKGSYLFKYAKEHEELFLRYFMRYLWECGLLTESPDELDYEEIVWNYLKHIKKT